MTTERQLQRLKTSAKRCNMTKNRYKSTTTDAKNYKKTKSKINTHIATFNLGVLLLYWRDWGAFTCLGSFSHNLSMA